MLAIIFAVAFIFFILLIRLFSLSIVDGEILQIKAVEQWVRTLPLKAKRGSIVDINGNILAQSETSYNVYVRAKEIENAVEVSRFLSDLLNLSFEKTYEKVKNVFISESLIKLQISEKQADKIVNKNYAGVYLTENISREYLYNEFLSQVLGYLTSDGIGQSGFENYYNLILSGTDGKYLTQSDVRGLTLNNSLNYYIDGIDGLNACINIDINIQGIVETVIKQIVTDHNPKSVSAIIMDPETSNIISMAIYPSFDLNNIPREDTSQLISLSTNTTVSSVYEPGSTFKILTLAAALSENLTYLNERFYCPGYRIVDGEKIKCWKTTGHGSQTLVECVQNSCNCCFMDLALRLGKEKLYKYLKSFGIGNITGVDITGESSGIMLDIDSVQNVDLARIGFGQTVAVSQLQLINAFCSVINGGTLFSPSLLSNFYDENSVIYYKDSTILNKNISRSVSNQIIYLLEQSLSKTGEMTFIDGYKVAGKTGTAQKYGGDGKISRGKYVSSFFGFLNSNNNPQYALLLCVDEPSSGVYYGSVVAKPYAKSIFEQIIEYKNIKKDDENVVSLTYFVPDLVGISISEAVAQLEKLNVYYEVDGDGEIVQSQYPLGNNYITSSTTILIKTN